MFWMFNARRLAAIEAKQDLILAELRRLNARGEAMSQELDDLTAQVAANTSVEQSAITLINGLAAKLEAAGTDPAALASLKASLKTSADALAAAVAANTPAAPATPPTT